MRLDHGVRGVGGPGVADRQTVVERLVAIGERE